MFSAIPDGLEVYIRRDSREHGGITLRKVTGNALFDVSGSSTFPARAGLTAGQLIAHFDEYVLGRDATMRARFYETVPSAYICVAQGIHQNQALYTISQMPAHKQWQTGRDHWDAPIMLPAGTGMLTDLPDNLSVYVQDKDCSALNGITLTKGQFNREDKVYTCIWHLLHSYRKQFNLGKFSGSEMPLYRIFVTKGWGKGQSLGDLLQTQTPIGLNQIGTGEDAVIELSPPPASYLPDNLALYCDGSRSARVFFSLHHTKGWARQTFRRGSATYQDIWHLTDCLREITGSRPYEHVYVAKGKYKDKSLMQLFSELHCDGLATVGETPVAADHREVPVPEIKERELHAADLEVIRAQMEHLRVLIERLFESRNILKSPESDE